MEIALAFFAALLVAGAAAAQPCDYGPFTSEDSLATIRSAIDAAADGKTVCLHSLGAWDQTGGTAIVFVTPHPSAARVTVCTSSDTQCDNSDGNASIRMTWDEASEAETSCWSFQSTGSGYQVKNIDCIGLGTCASGQHAAGPFWPTGLRDVAFEGGVYDGWAHMSNFSANTTEQPPTRIRMGTCANPIEFRGCYGPSSHVHYGHCRDCGFSYWIHDYGWNERSGGQGHHLDFAGYGNVVETIASENVTIECNLWETNTDLAPGTGDVLRISDGKNIIIRDNVFRKVGGAECIVSGIGFVPHGNGDPDRPTDGDLHSHWSGADIYRNRFELGDCFNPGVFVSTGSEVRIHENVFDLRKNTAGEDFWGTVIANDDNPNNPRAPDGIWVYGNTIYAPENQSDSATVRFCGAGCGTGHRFFNNIIVEGKANNAEPLHVDDCEAFGAGGADIKNNFIQTPNSLTPVLPSCPAQGPFVPGAPWSTSPGFEDASGGDFRITASSPVHGFGALVGVATDFEGLARPFPPSPPSIGAYDVPSVAPPSAPGAACGVGPELTLILPLLGVFGRRRASRGV